jgi:hypothetical protein
VVKRKKKLKRNKNGETKKLNDAIPCMNENKKRV